MDIIPVIDLLNGQVVHARRGDRLNYRPIQSHLCDGSEPLSIVRGLLELYPFKRLYIADLDAIQGRSGHDATILAIRQQHPGLEIWLDAAIREAETALSWRRRGVLCVIGSESLQDIEAYAAIVQPLENQCVLSLDFARGNFLGPAGLLQQPALWPARVIAMNLDRVGSDDGPDRVLLHKLRSDAKAVYAAGGVRDAADLQSLATEGMAGALVASALHSGRLDGQQICAIHRHPSPTQR